MPAARGAVGSWVLGALTAGEELATIYTDTYKLGLLALRLLTGDHDDRVDYLAGIDLILKGIKSSRDC